MKRLLVSAILVVAGCTDSPEPKTITLTGGEVSMDELSQTWIAGSYTIDGDTLDFEGKVLETNLITTTVKLHGMTIDATLDTRDGNRMWSQDAFATDTGADTVVSEEDQAVIYAFVKTLEKQYPAISKGDGLAFHFGVVINYWAQWIPAMEVTRIKFEDRDRAHDMCWFAQSSTGAWPQGDTTPPASGSPRYHNYDGHDCDTCSGDPMQGQGISSCSSYGGFGVWDSSTWYYYNGGWYSSSNGHGGGAGSYLEGDCFGRYGAGCGGGHGYFEENASHDHCVRDGHSLISAWCSDELASTTSPYNCY
jgi:hypothetical protein